MLAPQSLQWTLKRMLWSLYCIRIALQLCLSASVDSARIAGLALLEQIVNENEHEKKHGGKQSYWVSSLPVGVCLYICQHVLVVSAAKLRYCLAFVPCTAFSMTPNATFPGKKHAKCSMLALRSAPPLLCPTNVRPSQERLVRLFCTPSIAATHIVRYISSYRADTCAMFTNQQNTSLSIYSTLKPSMFCG